MDGDVHITNINRFHPEDWPWKFLLQLLSFDVFKRVQLTSYTVLSAPGSTWKNSASHFLSLSIVPGYTKKVPINLCMQCLFKLKC